jgi:hypothetical protein
VKVGLPASEQAARLKAVRSHRQAILDDLKKVDKELNDLSESPLPAR